MSRAVDCWAGSLRKVPTFVCAALVVLLVQVAAGRARADCGPTIFTTTGALQIARRSPALALLQNGKVLVVGGASTYWGSQGDDRAKNQTAEIYDPSTGQFSPVALTRSVTAASATTLADGRVLIAGGYDAYARQATSGASIYDPATGAVTNTGSLLQARRLHTATLLPDGRVLIAGGAPGGATAELYDPATGQFTSLPAMSAPRVEHTATLLHTGKVLLVSGRSSELFDPATRTFGSVASTAYLRSHHTATLLLDGRVLLAGGDLDPATAYGNTEAETYDPATSAFTRLTSSSLGSSAMRWPRHGHSATLLPDGRVLLAGGHDGPWSAQDPYYWRNSATTEAFDPVAGRFAFGISMTRVRSDHSAILLKSGRVLLVGGQGPIAGSWYDFFTGTEISDATFCTGFAYQGCYTDSSDRALPVQLMPAGATVESCVTAARARGLPYAGLQWYGACFAGYAPLYTRTADSECNTRCSANPAQTCGGGWRSSVFATGAVLAAPPTSASLGCYYDDPGRAMDALLIPSGATVESCTAAAAARGFPYAGLQYYGQCYAGGAAGTAAPAASCNTPCSASPGETCGGAWRNSVYSTGATAPAPSPRYLGCYTDGDNRGLPAELILGGATVESCVAAARATGYRYAGLQWHGACFAGNSLWYAKAPEGECNLTCDANPAQKCGGSWHNSVYETGL